MKASKVNTANNPRLRALESDNERNTNNQKKGSEWNGCQESDNSNYQENTPDRHTDKSWQAHNLNNSWFFFCEMKEFFNVFDKYSSWHIQDQWIITNTRKPYYCKRFADKFKLFSQKNRSQNSCTYS